MQTETERPLVGVMIAQAAHTRQHQTILGIATQAATCNVDLVVFSNVFHDADINPEIALENHIYDLALSPKLDGWILHAETMQHTSLWHQICALVQQRSDIAGVVTGGCIEGFPSICIDTASDIAAITGHLIETHHLTVLDFLTGADSNPDARQRVSGFQHALAQHGIVPDDDNVIFGDFQENSGRNLAQAYLQGKRRLPQAVVCANDDMAFGLCDALVQGGIQIPQTLMVVGYEAIGQRPYHSVILTTFRQSRDALGQAAFCRLYETLTGQPGLQTFSLAGTLVKGNSCSCGVTPQQFLTEVQELRMEQSFLQVNATGMLEQALTECQTLPEFVAVLRKFSFFLPEISGLFLCLYDDWCKSVHFEKKTAHEMDDLLVGYPILDSHSPHLTPTFFSKKEIFPASYRLQSQACVFYCCPIFYGGEEFGYAVMRFAGEDHYGAPFCNWMRIVSHALKFLKMKNDVEYLLQCQNLSVLHDSLTDLYSAKGMENAVTMELEHAHGAQRLVMVMARIRVFAPDFTWKQDDSNHNDVHMLTHVAESLQHMLRNKNAFCGRIDDDTFLFAGIDTYTDDDVQLLAGKMQVLIQHCPSYQKQYGAHALLCVSVSCPANGAVYRKELERLGHAMQQATQQRIQKMQLPYAQQYRMLRNQMYLAPQFPLSASAACQKFRLSYGHFRATYKHHFDISYHQDCILARISLAQYLLLTTTQKLSEIADLCGYDDDKYFMHQFRQIVHCTPNQYRLSL